jgi:hypothetical protein
MRRLLLLCLLIPVIGMSQTKTIVSSQRMFAKTDKVLEFEKALGTHAQKYHTGDTKWRVFSVQSGPDAGGYHVTEGPTSWEFTDSRGEISLEHNLDYNKSVAPYAAPEYQSNYFEFLENLSTVKMTEYSNKIQITHWFPKPGYNMAVRELIGKMKKVWEADGIAMAVYVSVGSGQTQYTLVRRFKNGFKDMAVENPVPFKARFEKANGDDSMDEYLTVLRQYMDKSWSELLEYRPDLSSK